MFHRVTYGTDVFGFAEALRIVLGGGMAARKDWEEGVRHVANAWGEAEGEPVRHESYPAGSFLFLPKGALSSVMVREEKATGLVTPLYATRGMHFGVHKPGEDPEDQEWILHSCELFSLDWVEVFK